MSSNKNRNQIAQQTGKKSDNMAKNTVKIDDAAAELVSAFEQFVQSVMGGSVSKPSKKSDPVDEDEDDEDEDEDGEEGEELTREMVEEATAEGIKALRTLAAEYLEDAPKAKADILAEFEEILGDEDDEDEDEDEDDDVEDVEDDDEDGDEEDDEWDRDALEEEDLKSLRKIAKGDFELEASEIKGLDKDSLIDLMLGEEDEDEDDEEEEDDEDVEELDEDALKAMTQKDLMKLAKDDLELTIPRALAKNSAANKKKIIALILDSGEDEE